jgi:hypothetical protein
VIGKYFLLWLPMIVVAFANATIRQLIFVKYFNDLRSHQLSTLTLIILCSVYAFFIFPLLHIRNAKQALTIGFIWVVLTAIFEFSLGRVTKKSWSTLLEQYDLTSGHIWPIFLFSLLLLPCLFYMLRK